MPTDLTGPNGGFDVVQTYTDHARRVDPNLGDEELDRLISAVGFP